MSADVVVAGSGVIGASIAYHLAKAGADVVLVDRQRPGSAPSASWASAGGLRSQGRAAAERPISLMASARWRTLADELDADLEIRFGGHLHVAETEAEEEVIERRIAEDRAGGVAIERLRARDLARLWPALTPSARLGAYTAGDGQAHPARAAQAFAAAAERRGTKIVFGELTLATGPDGALAVRIDDNRIAAGQVVLAAGAWSVAMLDRLGLVLPVRWRGLQMLLSEIAPPLIDCAVTAVGRNLSLKQSPSGQMMVGGRWLAAPVENAVDATPVARNIAPQWAGAVAMVPAMARLSLAQHWAGVEAQTIEGMPLIGPTKVNGLYAATGFSNHGFQIGPTIGELVAADILTAAQPLLSAFRPERFSGVDPSQITRFRAEALSP